MTHYVSEVGFHYRPVSRVILSLSIISNLVLVHLNSSTRLDVGKNRAPFPLGLMLLKHLDNPGHRFNCLFNASLQSLGMGWCELFKFPFYITSLTLKEPLCLIVLELGF